MRGLRGEASSGPEGGAGAFTTVWGLEQRHARPPPLSRKDAGAGQRGHTWYGVWRAECHWCPVSIRECATQSQATSAHLKWRRGGRVTRVRWRGWDATDPHPRQRTWGQKAGLPPSPACAQCRLARQRCCGYPTPSWPAEKEVASFQSLLCLLTYPPILVGISLASKAGPPQGSNPGAAVCI